MSRLTPRIRGLSLLAGLVMIHALAGCNRPPAPADDPSWTIGDGPAGCPGPVIHVIAVENQYGSIVSRLGGQGVRSGASSPTPTPTLMSIKRISRSSTIIRRPSSSSRTGWVTTTSPTRL